MPPSALIAMIPDLAGATTPGLGAWNLMPRGVVDLDHHPLRVDVQIHPEHYPGRNQSQQQPVVGLKFANGTWPQETPAEAPAPAQ